MRSPVTNSAPGWVALVLAAVLLAGCGGEAPPAEAAPELADRLALVDRAVASGDETSIRRRVESLVAATESARDDGLIDDVQEDRILMAARALLARLPEAPAPEPTPSESPTPSPTPDEDDGDEDEEEKKAQEEAEKRRKELETQREEEAKKREEEAKKQEEEEGDD